MSRLSEGDKSQAVCSTCQSLVDITYKNGYYRPADPKRVLLGYCDVCGEMVSIPAESSVIIRALELGLDDHGE